MNGVRQLIHNVYRQLARPTSLSPLQQQLKLTQGYENLTCEVKHTRSFASVQKEYLGRYSLLQPKISKESNLSIPSNIKVRNVYMYKTFSRSFWWGRKKKDSKKKRTPKLILLQNPITWIMIKVDFSVLRHLWDPTFRERDFKYGTKQAIARITQVISEGQLRELNGLLTKAARHSLERELSRHWSEKQRSLLALDRDDIQISAPRKVYFIRIAEKKFCDVDMAFLALKWAPISGIDALIFTEIFARFHREYTPHCIPEWTVAFFKVTRFKVLRKKIQEKE